jgi:hypothetical protein
VDCDVICYSVEETEAVIDACNVILPKEAPIGFRVLIATFLGIYSVGACERGISMVYRCPEVRKEDSA